jgi:hypothetical protein
MPGNAVPGAPAAPLGSYLQSFAPAVGFAALPVDARTTDRADRSAEQLSPMGVVAQFSGSCNEESTPLSDATTPSGDVPEVDTSACLPPLAELFPDTDWEPLH